MAKQRKSKEFGTGLEDAIASIQKMYGREVIVDPDLVEDVDIVPSGSFSLDLALGVGGYPRGRIIEQYGPESTGKTTLALHAIAEAQRLGEKCAFIDVEHALSRSLAEGVGVDMHDLILSQPDYGEQALEVVDMLVRSGDIAVIVVDSVAALVPKAEIDGDMGDSLPGLQARLMSQALRKLTASVKKSNTTVIFINQLRQKIGITFGSGETTTGGNALKFYASVRLDIRRLETIKQGEKAIGNKVRVRVVKNKVAPPFGEAHFDIIFGQGIDSVAEMFDLAMEHKIVVKSGSWYSFKNNTSERRIGQGREACIEIIREKPETVEWLRRMLSAHIKPKLEKVVAASSNEPEAEPESLAEEGYNDSTDEPVIGDV